MSKTTDEVQYPPTGVLARLRRFRHHFLLALAETRQREAERIIADLRSLLDAPAAPARWHQTGATTESRAPRTSGEPTTSMLRST
jgi:hypothetical protein